MLLIGAAVFVAAAGASAAAPSPREEVSFSFGWRFHRGDPAGTAAVCPAEDFDRVLSEPCNGTFYCPVHSAEDCRKACCPGSAYHPNCTVWTFLYATQWVGNKTIAGGCYLGDAAAAATCGGPNTITHTPAHRKEKGKGKGNPPAWTGGKRTTPWPSLAEPPAFARVDYDAAGAGWAVVDAPHDFVIDADFDANATDNGQHGYLPRDAPGWYRKRFALPADWAAGAREIQLRFDGVFHVTQAWLDGAPLALTRGAMSGYTSFTARLPTMPLSAAAAAAAPGHLPDAGQQHVLALRVDASFGSGHWYEGGGLYRDVTIIATSPHAHIVEDGFYAATAHADGAIRGAGWSVDPVVEVVDRTGGGCAGLSAVFSVVPPDGGLVAQRASDARSTIARSTGTRTRPGTGTAVPVAHPGPAPHTHTADTVCTLRPAAPIVVRSPGLWTIQSPTLYTASVEIQLASGGGGGGDDSSRATTTVDAKNVTIGFREANFTPDHGFWLNGERVVIRGFSNHNDMAGVGAAIPARLNLFRAQMLRAVGGNTWRMSHNPGSPVTFGLFDRLGIMSWDENRDYGHFQAGDMEDMVRRDRNHPSIVIWSVCNEIECQEASDAQGAEYRRLALGADRTRPISGNLLHDSAGTMIDHFDVVGVSHSSTTPFPWTTVPASWYDPSYSYDYFHAHHPEFPLVASEGSSCNTQRGPNVVDPAVGAWDDVFNADCLSKTFCPAGTQKAKNQVIPGYAHSPGKCTQSWTMAYHSNGSITEFMSGNLGVWTLFDYLGEPSSDNRQNGCHAGKPVPGCTPNWPQVSCNFGSFDLAGFAKPAAWHYRAWWLADIPVGDPSRPPVTAAAADVVKIVHAWDGQPAPPVVAVYSNLPSVGLFLNGKALGRQRMGWANWTQWAVPFAAGNLTAVGYTAAGVAAATDAAITPGAATGITLQLDAPSAKTGTGSALLLDGQDAALVRVSVVDKDGAVVASGRPLNVSFSVVRGPGRVIGVGNGDPVSHERNKASWRTTYYGLARAVVQVTENCVTTDRSRQLAIDTDGGIRTKVSTVCGGTGPGGSTGTGTGSAGEEEPILLRATAAGFAAVDIAIPTSSNLNAGVMSTASANVHAHLSIE